MHLYMKKLLLLIPTSVFLSLTIFSQVSNDDCSNPIVLGDVQDWCSQTGAFSNVNATPSLNNVPGCFSNISNDVWFEFTAIAKDIVITITGKSLTNPGGSLLSPEAALYYTYCDPMGDQLLACQEDNNNGIIELYHSGLYVGEKYLIRVDGKDLLTGTFQLCIKNYNIPQLPNSDCPTAAILCDKSAFAVQSVKGAGNDKLEMDDALCFSNGSSFGVEMNSTWFCWKARDTGSLTFSLTPNKVDDDLDFVLYELPNGIGNCTGKNVLRCMASGDNVYPSKCMGPTGLKEGETDIEEPAGCGLSSQSNFLAPLQMQKGKSYALVINNFTGTGTGFSLKWGGTGEFEGPTADFSWLPGTGTFQKPVVFTDETIINAANIVGWTWSFGENAVPKEASGQGPHSVIFNNYGVNHVTLIITTDSGCKVTTTKEVFISKFPTSSNEISAITSFKIYPNPAHNIVNAQIYVKESFYCQLKLVDALGKTNWVSAQKMMTGENQVIIPLDQLTAGQYFLQLRSGSKLAMQELVVK